MKVKLIYVPKGFSPEVPYKTAEELLVYLARISNPGNQDNMETAPNLINFLIRNKHWSPFEMVDMIVEITTSRAIAAQILRHRSFVFQEFSQRYSKVSEFEDVEIREAGSKNRQGSLGVVNPFLGCGFGTATEAIKRHIEQSQSLYEELIEGGVAKESARMVLPLTTRTSLYMKGSLRSWIHYLEVRTDAHVQKEHRQIAEEIKKIFCEQFPYIAAALNWI